MATEKLAKAYFQTLPKKHLGLMKLLTALSTNAKAVSPLGFASLTDLNVWVTSVAAVGDAVEKLAPACAGAGPNPEYPWPPGAETLPGRLLLPGRIVREVSSPGRFGMPSLQ